MDERQKNMIATAFAKVLVIVYIALFVIGAAKFAASGSISACLPELIFIIAVPILVVLFLRGSGKASFPMSIAGMAVDPDGSKPALLGRVRAYILDSLQYSLIVAAFICLMDVKDAYSAGILADAGFNGWMDMFGKALVQFIGFFVIYLAMDFGIYEYKAKRFREQQLRREQRKSDYKALLSTTGDDAEEPREEVSPGEEIFAPDFDIQGFFVDASSAEDDLATEDGGQDYYVDESSVDESSVEDLFVPISEEPEYYEVVPIVEEPQERQPVLSEAADCVYEEQDDDGEDEQNGDAE